LPQVLHFIARAQLLPVVVERFLRRAKRRYAQGGHSLCRTPSSLKLFLRRSRQISPIADSSLDGSEHYEHGIRKIASGEIKPDLICNAQWRETFDLKL